MVYMLAAGLLVMVAAVLDASEYLRESLELVPLPADVRAVILVRPHALRRPRASLRLRARLARDLVRLRAAG